SKAPAKAGSPVLKIEIELTAQRLVYTSEDGRFETKVDGTTATSSAPARCKDELTPTQRQTGTRAWVAGGQLIVTRASEVKFPAKGSCGGTSESLNETLAFKLDNGTCTFGYTGVTKRNGATPVWVSILPPQPCEAKPPVKPNVAQV